MKDLTELLDIHDDLDDLFFNHQCALLRADFPAALDWLEKYEAHLLPHMTDEEEILLPIYEERAEYDRAAVPKLFTDDHEKMRGFVDLFKEHTAKLAFDTQPERRLILLLDREAFYKRLSSHHDKREREVLYPALDAVTTEEEKIEIERRLVYKPSGLSSTV